MAILTSKSINLKDGTTVTIRTPEVDEAPALLAYLDAVRRSCDTILFDPDDELPSLEFERGWIAGNRAKPGTLMVGAYAGDALIALCSVAAADKVRIRHTATLGISIAAGWRGRGLGRVLMDELIRFAREHPGIEQVYLGVLADNTVARRLYARCGFVECGVEPGRIKRAGGYVDHVNMVLGLRPAG